MIESKSKAIKKKKSGFSFNRDYRARAKRFPC